MQKCKNYKQNLQRCNCTWPSCPRKGICCECLAYHLSRNELPACFFNTKFEASYDRSFENFVKQLKQENEKQNSEQK